MFRQVCPVQRGKAHNFDGPNTLWYIQMDRSPIREMEPLTWKQNVDPVRYRF